MPQLIDPTQFKRLVPIIFALGMGLLAVFFNKQWVDQQKRVIEQERKRLSASYQEPIEVIVAAKDLPEGTTIEAVHLHLAKIPKSFVQSYAVRNPQDVVGLVTVAPIAEREQILLNKLRRADAAPQSATLSGVTPKGKRAVTIGVDAITGVGGFVRPGDSVDILWSFKLPSLGQQEGQIVLLPLFQDVTVLAVGGEMIGRQAEGANRSNDFAVTLALDPQQAAFLLVARDQGRIQLSLRPKGESGASVALGPSSINTLLEAKLGVKSTPPPPPKPSHQVEVYRGLKRDVVLLPPEEESSASTR